ncbi:MAG TPA: 4Fe-4S dicluster domain-containing protein, partial [Acetobacteraceae bacterium]|nr:4Fe-4S dicluster domain-containing protein [Acetobacteraceae bacterium]
TGLLNPNRIVRAPRMDDRTLFRYGPGYAPITGFTPKLDWSAHPGALGGMLGAVEMCNNNGTCRGFDAGVMCPSYRVTRDEEHVTRGRANTLRLALTGQLGADAMASDHVAAAMALCVSCKGCRRECPTGVDMAKMKIEVLAERAARHGLSRRERLIAGLPRIAPIASRMRLLANARNTRPPLRRLGERWFGIAAERPLPVWDAKPFRDAEITPSQPSAPAMHPEPSWPGLSRPSPPSTVTVFLFADTFNRWFEPENLRAAIRVLTAAGYRPTVPAAQDRPFCCGRTYLAAGLVEQARTEARRVLAAFARDMPVIGLEPSCLLTLRDEFPSLVPGAATRDLAARAMLLSEFFAREKPALTLHPLPISAHVHGHCHQKSFGAFPDMIALLRRIPRLDVRPIASSCCGMAGAFGYQAETLAVSKAMAEAALLPAVRAAPPDALIVADGTSCRHQIADLAGRRAVHSVRVLDRSLED